MIINYPTFLPNALRSSVLTKEEYFKKTERYFYSFETERIIKKHDSIILNFEFSKSDFIEFEDFYVNDLKEGQYSLSILCNDGKGNIAQVIGDVFGGLNISVSASYITVSCLFIIKKKI